MYESLPQPTPLSTAIRIFQRHYPPGDVARILECGAELPLTTCPPWWRLLARRRWIRDMNGRIALARIYGWRTNRGPARHHLMMAKYSPPPGTSGEERVS